MNPIYKFQLSAIGETRPVNYYNKQPKIGQYDGKYILKSDGTLADSTPNFVVEFAVTDTSKKYYASGRVGQSTAACFVAYYTSNGDFISNQFPSTGTARVFDRELLTIPVNCGKIRVQGYNDGSGTIYLAQLFIGESRSFPIYNNDLAKDFEKESGQEFFRAKLSGKLVFQSDDYTYIVSKAFDTQFVLDVFISYDAGQSWASYWRGTFWKTDCAIDEDTQTITVNTLGVLDQYNDVLAGLDKEYNLVDLSPSQVMVFAKKRPIVQVYIPGQSVLGCFLSGMWWEQECDIVNEDETINVGGTDVNKLTDYLHYSKNKVFQYLGISGSMTPQLPDYVVNEKTGETATTDYFEFTVGNFKYSRYQITNFDGIAIYNATTGMAMWVNTNVPRGLKGNYSVTLSPVSEQGATGSVTLNIQTLPVYARYICDVLTVLGNNTYELPTDDQTDNRNYKRVIGYNDPSTIVFSTQLVSTPTQWGIYQPGMYYAQPSALLGDKFFPVARNAWGKISCWFVFSEFSWIAERSGRKEITMKDCYSLSSVISVLLNKIAPGITHLATTDYSQFLYGENLLGIEQTLLITPKSNVISSGYDQPAQQAKITLKQVLDMLRDCFRCYWFIDDDNRFRIEHIQYFRNGGSYDMEPEIGIDLTTMAVPASGKKWAFAFDKYSFDKPEMTARYQFGWMDDVTQQFEGYPIDILAKFVNRDKIENIDIVNFTSDLDYILLNPSAINKDGFVLMAGIEGNSGEYSLPFITFNDGQADYELQNAWVAFCFLVNYYLFDLPAKQYSINGVTGTAMGVKRLKKQSVSFPALTDPDILQMIKTNLGNGTIAKISVNLSSRNAKATLEYDTEQ